MKIKFKITMIQFKNLHYKTNLFKKKIKILKEIFQISKQITQLLRKK